MDGILNILKPPGMTSFDVVGYLRGVLKTRKIGHTGTLDPGAVGVLPICVGSATKAIEFMTEKDKVYRVELVLGTTTDTQDSYGKILDTREVNVSPQRISEAIKAFVGKMEQIPPMYSAIKIEGKKLYELARSGIIVERQPRPIEIYSINIIKIDGNRAIFDAACSKGTYIRTLCSDIGERLGCGGHMSFLVRLKAGNFDISSAVTLEKVLELSKGGKLEECFMKVDEVFKDFHEVTVDEVTEKKLLNGAFIDFKNRLFIEGQFVRIYNKVNRFIALGEVLNSHGNLILKTRKTFL